MERQYLLVMCLLTLLKFSLQVQKYELLSEGMAATQSSTYHSYSYQFVAVASMAVDGNISQLWADKSCSCTTKSTNPWWQVDFVGLVRVTYVTVYNRKHKGDRLSGFKVFLSNDTINDVLCADGPHNTTNGQIINLKCQNDDKAVRIVRIKLPSVSQYLTLCEVKVYGQWIEKDKLLSEKMPTSQSSTFFGKSEFFYYDSSLAVDGNINQEWAGKSCSSTNNSGDRWWQLYLIGAARVSLVSIYTAVDENNQLSEFNVLAGLSIYKLEVCASVPQAVTSGRIIGLKCEDLLAARFIRIQLVGDRKRYLTLCEVKIYGELIRTDDLFSNDRSAIQSSIQRHRAFSIHASNVVDGNTNQRLSENSCTMTKNGKDSWWMVDLVTLHWVRQNYAAVSVRFVSIYNRGDCCGEWLSGFKVLISGKPFKYFRECASGPEKTRTGEIIHLECRATAQYLRIQLFGEDTTLSLCEVKIYGVPFR